MIDIPINQPSLAAPPETTASLFNPGWAIAVGVSVWTEFVVALPRSFTAAAGTDCGNGSTVELSAHTVLSIS